MVIDYAETEAEASAAYGVPRNWRRGTQNQEIVMRLQSEIKVELKGTVIGGPILRWPLSVMVIKIFILS